MQVWVGLCEMAKTCRVPIFSLYTQGQQIKVFSQIYKECMYSGFVVEKLDLVPGEPAMHLCHYPNCGKMYKVRPVRDRKGEIA